MNEFKMYHPIVNFVYFAFVIGFSMVFMHPGCLIISLICSFSYSVVLGGREVFKKSLLYMIPALLAMAMINPSFNHGGVTIIGYLPDGNPLTAESVIYGFAAAVMIVSVVLFFSCYNKVMTSDKFIYLFGRIIPSLSLILSMTLRLVPRFAAQLRVVKNAQKCIGRDISSGSIINRARHGLRIVSIMVTWALENAIDTADSMKSRGYGLKGRTAFSIYTFSARDRNVLILILALGIYIIIGGALGGMYFSYFPYMQWAEPSVYGISLFAAYIGLGMLPVIIELCEVRKWNVIKSRI